MTFALRALLTAAAALLLVTACTPRLPPVDRAELKPKTAAELQKYVVTREPDVDVFRARGPFRVTVHENHELRLAPKEIYRGDLFAAGLTGPAPLVIILHGYDSSKAAHYHQAVHLASWGMHAMTVALPPKGPWSNNGRILARIVSAIHASPELMPAQIDRDRIIMVGFSFGATAVAVALAQGAPAAGGIFLDPAAIGKGLPQLMRRIDKPVLVIGADEEVSSTRNREYFYDFIRSTIAEVSIRGAAHEDGQYPSDEAIRTGSDPNTTEDLQIAFAAALTSAALSLAATGGFDYAWETFGPALQSGRFINARKR